MLDVIVRNYAILMTVFGMAMIVLSNKSLDKRINHTFAVFCLLVLILEAADMSDYWLEVYLPSSHLRYFTAEISYILRITGLVIHINILMRRKRLNPLVWTPLLFLTFLCLTNSFTHLVFYYNEQYIFTRGVLAFAPHFIGALYMILLVFLTYSSYQYLDFGEMVTVGFIAVNVVAATIIEAVWNYRFVLSGVMMVGCTLYYIILYAQTYKRDLMTGALNRRSFYADAEDMSNINFAVISIDMNQLKEINDTYGHHAGDEALIAFASAALKAANKQFRIYRTGGDEFMALGKNCDEQKAEQFIIHLKNELKDTPYTASYGCEIYHPGENFDEICISADQNMYKDKQKYRHRTSSRDEN